MTTTWYARGTKRVLDVAVSSLALGMSWPVLAAVAVAVRSRLGSPVLFRQPRPGQGGRTFTILKFRTMTDARDDRGRLLPDGVRLTGLGSRVCGPVQRMSCPRASRAAISAG